MNTYVKFVPNVFLAKCTEKHEKGEVIPVTTRYGKENDSIVFNLIGQKDDFFYYSIVRADGFNVQEWARRKAEKYESWEASAQKKSEEFFKKSHDIVENIPLGQPILVGHHSEARHRRDLNNSWNAMGRSVELGKKADEYENKAAYWQKRADTINISMPESMELFEFQLEEAKRLHEGLKNGSIPREHGYSLTYAKKAVNDLEKKLQLAKRLWL